MKFWLPFLVCLVLAGGAHAQQGHEGHDHEQHQHEQDGHDHGDAEGHNTGPGGFNVDARQHADEVDNAAYEFMVRSFYTQPWRDSKAPEVMMGRAVPIWILVVLLLLARRFRGPR